MNPEAWEDLLRRLRRHMDQKDSSNTAKALTTSLEHSNYTVDESHTVDMEWEELAPTNINCFGGGELRVENPGKKQKLMEDFIDLELERKRRELREIEQKIIFKKAAIASKKVSPSVSCDRQSTTHSSETLRDRVTLILQQRSLLCVQPKLHSSKKKTTSFPLEDHPLKLRVKALMKQRCRVLAANKQVSDIITPPLPPRQHVNPPVKMETSYNIGFQRFLSVLNKGVDIDLLSRIVNDNSNELSVGDDLLKVHPAGMEDMPTLAEKQPSQSSTVSGDRRTDLLGQVNPQNNMYGDEEERRKNDRNDESICSTSRSKSPPAVMKTEEKIPKVAVQQKELQNILKTLGLNLEVEELSKLAERTQERLYGKKNHGGNVSEVKRELGNQQAGSHRRYRNSSSDSRSSTSSSSLSRSTSRSLSPSNSKRQRVSEYSSSGEGSHKSEAAPRRERRDSKEIPTRPYKHSQEQTHPRPGPPALSTFSDYSVLQYSAYNSETLSPNTPTRVPPSPAPSEYPYPPITEHYFPRRCLFEDMNLLVNPDLSTCEGQRGTIQRYLRVIEPNVSIRQPCLEVLSNSRRRINCVRNVPPLLQNRKETTQKEVEMKGLKPQHNTVTVQMLEESPEGTHPKEEKGPQTEEDIKMNLRRKLEAFNQKMKQQVPQPVRSLTCHTESVDNLLESDRLTQP